MGELSQKKKIEEADMYHAIATPICKYFNLRFFAWGHGLVFIDDSNPGADLLNLPKWFCEKLCVLLKESEEYKRLKNEIIENT